MPAISAKLKDNAPAIKGDEMFYSLLESGLYTTGDFKVALTNNQRTYEVYFKGELQKTLPANWSSYWTIEDMVVKGVPV
jgi:hypothetical protein